MPQFPGSAFDHRGGRRHQRVDPRSQAGAAALVIQAYRKTHRGASPTPALVKQILVSSATDLGLPATEQGAGLLNSYFRRCCSPESIHTADAAPAPVGNTLLLSSNQLNAVGMPGTEQHWSVTVTNTGAYPQTVELSGRTFGAGSARADRLRRAQRRDESAVRELPGASEQLRSHPFPGAAPVQTGLDASIAYPGTPANGNNSRARLILIGPAGPVRGALATARVSVTSATWMSGSPLPDAGPASSSVTSPPWAAPGHPVAGRDAAVPIVRIDRAGQPAAGARPKQNGHDLRRDAHCSWRCVRVDHVGFGQWLRRNHVNPGDPAQPRGCRTRWSLQRRADRRQRSPTRRGQDLVL